MQATQEVPEGPATLGGLFTLEQVATIIGRGPLETLSLIVRGPLVAVQGEIGIHVRRDDLVAFLRERGAL